VKDIDTIDLKWCPILPDEASFSLKSFINLVSMCIFKFFRINVSLTACILGAWEKVWWTLQEACRGKEAVDADWRRKRASSERERGAVTDRLIPCLALWCRRILII